MRLFFIRHAESIKSKEDRHGGEGLPLTERGKLDVIDLSNWLTKTEKINNNSSIIFCSSLPQVIETAKILSNQTNIKFKERKELKNMYLGVLDGLTKAEALEKHPEAANQLELWRKEKLNIDKVRIPDAESPSAFYHRVMNFVTELNHLNYSEIIIIGTRSIGVAITNMLMNKLPNFNPVKYKRYLFDPSSVSLFLIEKNDSQCIYINKIDYLKVKPKYPDI